MRGHYKSIETLALLLNDLIDHKDTVNKPFANIHFSQSRLIFWYKRKSLKRLVVMAYFILNLVRCL